MSPDLQGHDALHAEVDLLQKLPCGPVVDVQMGAIVALMGSDGFRWVQIGAIVALTFGLKIG